MSDHETVETTETKVKRGEKPLSKYSGKRREAVKAYRASRLVQLAAARKALAAKRRAG